MSTRPSADPNPTRAAATAAPGAVASPSAAVPAPEAAAGGEAQRLQAADLARLRGLSLTLRVTAGAGRITLGRLRALQPGETLSLDRAGDGPLPVDCGGVAIGEVEVVATADGLIAHVVCLEGNGEGG